MADPLQLLRDFTIAGKPVDATDTQIIFNDLAADRKAETNFRTRDGYFTLEALWFLLQRGNMPHAKYIIECKKNGIPAVGMVDKKQVLDYMQGKTKADDRVDITKFGGVLTKITNRAATDDIAPVAKRQKLDEEQLEEKKRHAERLEAATTERAVTLTENIKPLSEKLSRERVAEIRAMRAAQKRQSIQAPDEDVAAQQKSFLTADEITTRNIIARERLLRTRETVLQSKRKRFDDVLKVLAGVRQREEAAKRANVKKLPAYNRYEVQEKDFWKERGKGTEEFQIDTGGGFLSRSKAPAQVSAATAKPGARPGAAPANGAKFAAPAEAIPIIIVSSAPTALLSLYNIKEFLEDGVYMTVDEVKQKGGKKPASVTITRDVKGKKTTFLVVDNTTKFKPQDWKRVVACVCHGAKWQFKGWAWNGDPAEIFANIKGVFMQYDDAPPDPCISSWAVQVLQVNRRKRWLDTTANRLFWDGLYEFLSKRNTSHLAL